MKCFSLVGFGVLGLIFTIFFTGKSSAQIFKVPGCEAVGRPHKSMTLGPGMPSVSANSTGIDYFGKPLNPICNCLCYRFVVDISVPKDSGAPGWTREFMLSGGGVGLENGGIVLVQQPNCTKYTKEIEIYKKQLGDKQFKPLGGGFLTAQWEQTGGFFGNPGCVLRPASGWKSPSVSGFFEPPASGIDVYRIAIAVKYGTKWIPVEARGDHFPIPK
jgi:hypothetical protein